MTRVVLEPVRGKDRKYFYSRKDEEYMADFLLVSRRTLDPADYRIFKYHFLFGADWRLCCRQLKMDRGDFFHAVYRIEQVLGRTFRELQPYGLYPLDEYFASWRRNEPVRPASNLRMMPGRALRPVLAVPLQKTA